MDEKDYYRKRAWKRLGIIACVVVVAGGVAWYAFRSDGPFQKIESLETSAAHIALEEISGTFTAPPPLVETSTAPVNQYTLTRAGVITDTNTQRAENGNLPALTENATLDQIASLRLEDMFKNQYFAHISPASSSAITVAAQVGYDYIALGENLALGEFEGDQGVVAAWMGSPGHRANILDTSYTQIGVAVGEGNFQGSRDWIAVQVFGRPASDCPAPDATLKAEIDAAQNELIEMQTEVQSMETEMDAVQSQDEQAYEQEVSYYNALVEQYNNVNTQTKTEIDQYNQEVDAYNTCLG